MNMLKFSKYRTWKVFYSWNINIELFSGKDIIIQFMAISCDIIDK